MTITHHSVTQGSPEWLALRCGMLTASEMHLLITPATKKAANNDKSRAHLFELAAQRITNFVEPHFVSDDMQRGTESEPLAIAAYEQWSGNSVQRVGFVTRSPSDGLTVGYSPDGFVGSDGTVEVKGPRAKHHVATVLGNVTPAEHIVQVQTGLWVSCREWCDFISYSGGLHLFVVRAYRDEALIAAIAAVAEKANRDIFGLMEEYRARVLNKGFPMTERVVPAEADMHMGDSE